MATTTKHIEMIRIDESNDQLLLYPKTSTDDVEVVSSNEAVLGKNTVSEIIDSLSKNAFDETDYSTYVKSVTASGRTITITKGDGSTSSFQTQDTTYGIGTSATSGLTHLYSGIGNNTNGTMTQTAITTALNGKADSTHTHNYAGSASAGGAANSALEATKAAQDSAGQQINTTYVKSVTASGRTITITKGDGSTTSFQTQDTNVDYDIGTSETAGLSKLYDTVGSNVDGSMTQNAITTALSGKSDTTHTHNYAGSDSAGGAANSALEATKATQDSAGQQINTTYVKSVTASGQTITITKGDGSTTSFQTQDTNTTYGAATSETAGLSKLYDTAGSNVDGSMTQSSITNALSGKSDTTHTHNNYVASVTASGQTITITKGDGSTTSFQTQDTNTTYGTGTSSTEGLTKLYDGVGSNVDGSMTQSAITTALTGKSDTTHTHNYAGSDSAGGAATKANQDSAGQQINTTYVKSVTANGRTITITKGDGSTTSFQTQDTNTTYSIGTTATAGLTLLYTATGSNTNGTMTQNAITTALNGKANTTHTHNYAGSASAGGAANSALTATKATQDSAGQQINTTYVKSVTASGRTITITKGDGTTTSFQTQDSDTVYSTGTSATAGITKLYDGVGANVDGSMTQNAITTALSGKSDTTHTHNYAGSATPGGSALDAGILSEEQPVNYPCLWFHKIS